MAETYEERIAGARYDLDRFIEREGIDTNPDREIAELADILTPDGLYQVLAFAAEMAQVGELGWTFLVLDALQDEIREGVESHLRQYWSRRVEQLSSEDDTR